MNKFTNNNLQIKRDPNFYGPQQTKICWIKFERETRKLNSASLVLYGSPFNPNFWKSYVNHVVNADFDSQDLNKLRDKTLLILPLSLLLAGWQRLEAFRRG